MYETTRLDPMRVLVRDKLHDDPAVSYEDIAAAWVSQTGVILTPEQAAHLRAVYDQIVSGAPRAATEAPLAARGVRGPAASEGVSGIQPAASPARAPSESSTASRGGLFPALLVDLVLVVIPLVLGGIGASQNGSAANVVIGLATLLLLGLVIVEAILVMTAHHTIGQWLFHADR